MVPQVVARFVFVVEPGSSLQEEDPHSRFGKDARRDPTPCPSADNDGIVGSHEVTRKPIISQAASFRFPPLPGSA